MAENVNAGSIASEKVVVHNEKRKRLWHLNKETLSYKIHYFLFVGGMGAILPYLSAFGINKLGLTASNLAAVYTTQQILFVFFKPMVGYLSDYFNKLKATIIGLTILQALFCLFLFNIPNNNVEHLLHSYNPHVNLSLNKLKFCNLCNNYDEFLAMSSSLPSEETILKKGVNCLKSTHYDYKIIKLCCPEQDISFCNDVTRVIKIVYRTCNSNNFDKSTEPSGTNLTSIGQSNLTILTIALNQTESIHIMCTRLRKLEIGFDDFNHTFSLMKEFCYFTPNNNSPDLQVLKPKLDFSTINISCDDTKFYKSDAAEEVTAEISAAIFKTYQFWLFAVFMIISCTCISCIFTISDTACYESIQDTGADYGKIRVHGALSWGLVAPLAGFLNDYTESYMASWLFMAVMCSLQILNMTKMKLVKPDFSQNIMRDLKTVFSSFEFVAFAIGACMNGAFTGVIWFYLTWFINDIGGSRLVIGLAHAVQCFLGELPCLVLSKWVLDKIGHFNVVSLALFTHGVRFFIYSYLQNPWWILPVEVLHGLTFGSFLSALTSYAKLKSKPGTEATTQSILQMTFEAIGSGLGGVIFGVCFDKFGSHDTFFYSSFICILATAINMVFTALVKIRNRAAELSPNP